MILFVASVENFFNWHAVIYFFLWRWRGPLDLVHKSRHRRVARHALVLRPTELYFRHAVIQILPDICRYILSNIHKFNSPDRLTYIRFFLHCFTFFWQIRLGREATGDSIPRPTPPSLHMHRSHPILSHKVSLSQVNFSEVSSFAIWTCFIIYTTKICQISKTEKRN